MLVEPCGPCAAHVAGEDKLGPEFDQLIDVYEATYVVVGAFGEDQLVGEGSIVTVAKVEGSWWSAPVDAARQLDDAMRLLGGCRIDVVRYGNRARGGPEGCAACSYERAHPSHRRAPAWSSPVPRDG